MRRTLQPPLECASVPGERISKAGLIPDCEVAGSGEAVGARKVVFKKMAGLESRGRVDSRTVLPGLVPLQRFHVHIF